jgi:hypothetical protein
VLKVIKANFMDLQSEYPVLYRQIFNQEADPYDWPLYIYLGYDDDTYAGMVTGCVNKLDTIYLQCGGFVDKFKGIRAIGLFREMMNKVHEEYDVIMLRAENTNIAMLKIAMNIGFRICGVRTEYGYTIVERVKRKGGNKDAGK